MSNTIKVTVEFEDEDRKIVMHGRTMMVCTVDEEHTRGGYIISEESLLMDATRIVAHFIAALDTALRSLDDDARKSVVENLSQLFKEDFLSAGTGQETAH